MVLNRTALPGEFVWCRMKRGGYLFAEFRGDEMEAAIFI
jgi:hypothetical protein